MHTYTWIFIIPFAISLGLQLWLSLRQARHVKRFRSAVPAEFADKVNLNEHQKAADYTVAKGRFGRFELLLGAVLLLLWTLGGGLNLLDQWVRSFALGDITTGVAVILSFTLISSLIDIPTSLYSHFVIEEKFGFNKLTIKTFFIDLF